MVDRDDPKDQHRHLSHMIALYPGHQISPLTTPKLAAAAEVSLTARGDGRTWSSAWKINLWARLLDGDHAHEIVGVWIRGSVLPNLFNKGGRAFQIDANFGYTAGVCEMLLQSHAGEIHLLPALPKAWPSGKVTGLRARGGFIVDIEWQGGQVIKYRVASAEPREVKVRINDGTRTIKSQEL